MQTRGSVREAQWQLGQHPPLLGPKVHPGLGKPSTLNRIDFPFLYGLVTENCHWDSDHELGKTDRNGPTF